VLASAAASRVVLWDTVEARRLPDPLESAEPVLALAWPAGARWLAGMTPTRVLLWELGAGQAPGGEYAVPQARPTSIAAPPDGERVAIGYDDGTVQLVRVDAGQTA
jgi:hypothetical protein